MTRNLGGRFWTLLGLALAIPVGCSSENKDEDSEEDASFTCVEGTDSCWCKTGEPPDSNDPVVKRCSFSTCFRYEIDSEQCECGPTGFVVDNVDARNVRAVAACPPGSGRGPSPGTGGVGGTGGTGTAGTGAGGTSGTGGSLIIGGTGGTGTAGKGGGGTSGTGTTGGTGTMGGAAGSGTAGTGGDVGPFTCPGVTANCNHFASFPISTAQSFGTGDFTGGISVFGAGITRDANDLTRIHVTGMVAGYGNGFVVWFTSCSDLSAYTGISFTMSGTAGAQNLVDFQLQTNSTFPWQPTPMDHKGSCTAPSGMDPYGACIPPTIAITTSSATATVTWVDLAGGTPVAWSPTTSPKEILGLQWQFPWSSGAAPYAVDISVSNLSLVGEGDRIECVPVLL